MRSNIIRQMTAGEFFKAILPSYGTPLDDAFKKKRWIPGMKYWLVSEYLKEDNGNYYNVGVRFVDNLLIVEKDGMSHSWTWLDGLEIYAFDGKTPRLIQKKSYSKCHRNEEVVRSELESMLADYARSQAKLTGTVLAQEDIQKMARDCIDRGFKDFLDDDYEIRLTYMMPLLLDK